MKLKKKYFHLRFQNSEQLWIVNFEVSLRPLVSNVRYANSGGKKQIIYPEFIDLNCFAQTQYYLGVLLVDVRNRRQIVM